MKRSNVWRIILLVIIAAVVFYFTLPPLNLRSPQFWGYILFVLMVSLITAPFAEIRSFFQGGIKNGIKLSAMTKITFGMIGVTAVLFLIGTLTGAKLFNASRYAGLLETETGSFTEDVTEISMSQIPLVDKNTAAALGARKLGEMTELVSQYEISDDYTQINYEKKPVRVTPLEYGDIIKWLNNRTDGIPAYIMVDMATQDTKLIKLQNIGQDNIHYSESEFFSRNINRYLRFKYPTKIFSEVSFEIDENGTPWWIASTVEYRIGLWSGRDINGAVLVNAITGENQFYSLEDIPSWVDRVFDADIIIEQLEYNGLFGGGFFNAYFGQKNVLQPTSGYNYLAIDDDVYLYTGITSVASDESNIGFILTNMRTKQTKFYKIPGAEEYSAMSSAEGQIQHLGYTATFPILLNIADRPTYFVSLKDDAGLVKMYAFVDVQQYQIVGTGTTVKAAKADYMNKLGVSDEVEVVYDTVDAKGYIERAGIVVEDGSTVVYLKLVNDSKIYEIPCSANPEAVLLEKWDSVVLHYSDVLGKNRVQSFEVEYRGALLID